MNGDDLVAKLRSIPPELVGLTAVGAALRLYRLGDESLWNDEFASMEDALALGPDILLEQLGVARPLYYLLLRPWIEIFGTTEVGMRSLSVLIGIAAIPAIYLLGRELYGRSVASVAALLLAFSRIHVRWSQDARMYGLLALLAILSYLAFVRYLDRGGRRERALYLGATALLGYTHLFAVFVVLAQNCYVLLSLALSRWRRPAAGLRGWIVTQASLAVLGLPAAVAVVLRTIAVRTGDAEQVGWIPMPSGLAPVTLLTQHVYKIMDPAVTLFAFLGIVGVVAVALYVDDGRRGADGMVSLWAGAVVFVPLVLSYLIQPMLQARYTMAGMPATVLLVGRGVAHLRDRIDEAFVRRLFVVGLVVVLAAPLLPYYQEDQKEQWREAGAFLEDEVEDGDVVLVSKSYTARNLRWYFDGDDDRVVGVAATADTAALERAIGDADRVWLVLSNLKAHERRALLERMDAVADPDGRSLGAAPRNGGDGSGPIRTFNGAEIRRYEPRPAEGGEP